MAKAGCNLKSVCGIEASVDCDFQEQAGLENLYNLYKYNSSLKKIDIINNLQCWIKVYFIRWYCLKFELHMLRWSVMRHF